MEADRSIHQMFLGDGEPAGYILHTQKADLLGKGSRNNFQLEAIPFIVSAEKDDH